MYFQGLGEWDTQRVEFDVREAALSASRLNTAYQFIKDNAMEAWRKTRSLGLGDVNLLSRKTDGLITRNLTPLMSHYARSKSQIGVEACHAVFLPVPAETSMREIVFQIHALRVFVSPTLIETECRPLPLAFRLHSAVRMMERDRFTGPAIKQAGVDLTRAATILRAAEAVGMSHLDEQMLVPSCNGQGALFGAYDPSYALRTGVVDAIVRGSATSMQTDCDPLAMPLFMANTFIGHEDMGLSQFEAASEMSMWRDWWGSEHEAAQRDLLWPNRRIGNDARRSELSEEAVVDLEEILTRPHVAYAISRNNKLRKTPKVDVVADYRPQQGYQGSRPTM